MPTKTKKKKNDTPGRARALLEDESYRLTLALVRKALRGNISALRLCIERLPFSRQRAIPIDIPVARGAAQIVRTLEALFQAIRSGEINASEGNKLAAMLENQRKAIETAEIEARIATLEAQEVPKSRYRDFPD